MRLLWHVARQQVVLRGGTPLHACSDECWWWRMRCMMLGQEFGAMVQAQVMFQAAADLGDSNGLVGQGMTDNLCLCCKTLSDMKLKGS